MANPYNVVVIVGSLRKESFTLMIANALARLAPDSVKLNVTTLHDISFFNQDLEATPPADWVAFREKLQKSNGVLFVTPEYNRSIPGVLKNAIDVGSRPYGKSSILGQPEIYLTAVGDAFDDKGELTKEALQKVLKQYIDAFAAFIDKQNK